MDRLPKGRRREVMQSIRRQDTPPEMVVRRCLHHIGCRFRVHRKDLPGKPDIVLRKWKTVVFVHGCFWHGCPECFRGHRVPKTNKRYWLAKVARNQARDRKVTAELTAVGWRVIIVWECETHDLRALNARLSGLFLKG